MKVLNLGVLSANLSRVDRPKTLEQIVREANASKSALNPYTVIGQKIIQNLRKHFIFPYLQPQVVNPLEFSDGQRFYVHKKNNRDKFAQARIEQSLGMDNPVGFQLCHDESGMPFFVRDDELSSSVAARDYHVSDYISFRNFLPRLVRDMSLLRPMLRAEIEKQYNPDYKFRKGDIVVILSQKYGKIGIVKGTARKEFLTNFYSPERIHAARIGVNLDELLPAAESVFSHGFEEYIHSLHLDRAGIVSKDKRPKFGLTYAVMAKSNYQQGQTAIGYSSVIGYDPLCATVVPHTFDEKEKFPWGELKEQTIPVSDLFFLGSIQDIKKGADIYARFFADDVEVMDCVQEITADEVDNPHTKGLIVFLDLAKYQRLYKDLAVCPQVPDELVAPQFISILTAQGIEGIERLAQISDKDYVDIAKELLAQDVKEAEHWLGHDEQIYGDFVEKLQEAVSTTTQFSSAEKLLEFAGPGINLYQMQRDGIYTLAYIQSFETLSQDEEDDSGQHLKKIKLRKLSDLDRSEMSGMGIDPDDYMAAAKKILQEESNQRQYRRHRYHDCEYMDINLLPGSEIMLDEKLEKYLLFGVDYKILRKGRSIRYGRDENFEMTYPGLQPIDSRFKLHPTAADFQYRFLRDVFLQIMNHVDFDGKGDFFAALDKLNSEVEERCRKDDDRHYHYMSNISSMVLNSITKLNNGVRQLTNSAEVKERIISNLLGTKPILLEAFYDYENLQKTIAIRDFWFRGHLPEKHEYLQQFGYYRKLPRSAFADEFYEALSEIDMYHRGFPVREGDIIGTTRHRTSSYSSFQREDSTLGLVPSTQADALLVGINKRIELLSEQITRDKVIGLLEGGDGIRFGTPLSSY